MEFHQNSTVIPDVYLWNASGIPLEHYFKIPAFFLEGKPRVVFQYTFGKILSLYLTKLFMFLGLLL